MSYLCVYSCSRPWSVCKVVFVPYVVGAVTVIRVLLFVLDVSMLRECDGDSNGYVGDERGVVAVSAGHEYVGGTRGLCLAQLT